MPRTLKADIQAANAQLNQQNTALELAIFDLVVRPESVIWISAGKPGSDSWVSWGLVRIAGAQGGYVIRRYGPKHLALPVETLDSLRSRLTETLAILVTGSDPDSRKQAENERQVMAQALATRNRALEVEAAKRVQVMTELAINPKS